MSERYSKIFTLSNDLYVKDCPVLIRAGALLKDNVTNNVLAQIKFENISPKIIIALKIKLIAKDIAGRDLEEEFQGQYLDLRVCRGDDFGAKTPIILTKDVRSIFPVVTEVVFSNNSLWQGEAKFIISLPKQELLENKLSEYGLWQYNKKFFYAHKYLLSERDNIWQCACGAINHEDETICYNCQCSYQSLKDINFSSLEKDGRYNKACDNMRYNTIESHQEAIELLEQIPDWHDSKEKIAKCSEKIEQIKAEEAAENKKRKITLAVLAVFAVICVVIGIVVNIIDKSNKYDAAMVLYNDCKYDEAYGEFSALKGFKDSEDYAHRLSLLLSEAGDVVTLGDYKWVVL